MSCEKCGAIPEGTFQPRVSISFIQETCNAHHGRGTLHMYYSTEVEQVLRDGEKDMGDYAAEIANLQSRILSIQGKKDRLEAHLRAYASLVAPIRRVPDEILGEIFEYYCSSPCALYLNGTGNGPLIVGAVCSHWRSIVHSTPSLWSRISLRLGPESAPRSILQLFLDRSKEVPLELVVDVYCSTNMFQKNPAFLAIASQAHRWRILTVHADSSVLFLQGLRELSGAIDTLPSLEYFSSDSRSDSLASDSVDLDLVVPMMPKLRSFSGIGGANYHPRPGIPWSQITHLSLLSYHRLGEFLGVCVNLTTLCILINPDALYPRVESRTTHNQVRNLTIAIVQGYDYDEVPTRRVPLAKVFNELTFPNLFSFTLEDATQASYPHTVLPTGVIEAFLDFLGRSGSNLNLLSLNEISIFHPHLITILRKVPSVVELSLGDCPLNLQDIEKNLDEPHPTVSSLFLENLHAQAFCRAAGSLSPSANPGPLLPNLQRLCLSVSYQLDLEDLFVDTIVSRWIPEGEYAKKVEVEAVSLRKVELRLGNEYFTFDAPLTAKLSVLKSLREQGMDVDVICFGKYVDL